MSKKSDWFVTFKPKHNASMRLFCFHYGGAGVSIFRSWANDVIDYAEVIAIQLPGREERYNEPLLKNIQSVVEELSLNFNEYTSKPFIFFGHSLGALIAFEFARELRRKGMPQPMHLIVSGTKAPHIIHEKPPIHSFLDEKFIRELKKYNGIPHSIIENKELISIFLPAIRSDFCIYETYEHKNECPLSYPITALGGLSDDTFDRKNLIEWKDQTGHSFKHCFLAGNHFFIKDSYKEVIAIVNSTLKEQIMYSSNVSR